MFRRTAAKLYRYQEFEMHNEAKYPFNYPREAPNTSVFHQYQLNFWMFWGYGRQELWIDRDNRRYETTWEMFRRLLMWFFPCYFVFPFGLPKFIAANAFGEYGEKPYLDACIIHAVRPPRSNRSQSCDGHRSRFSVVVPPSADMPFMGKHTKRRKGKKAAAIRTHYHGVTLTATSRAAFVEWLRTSSTYGLQSASHMRTAGAAVEGGARRHRWVRRRRRA